MKLIEKRCQPCEGGVPSLDPSKVAVLIKELSGWNLSSDGKFIEKKIQLKNFKLALDLVNKIGQLAERENHHPDILVSYSQVTLRLFTHAIGGLSENDFILAAKIDQLMSS